MTTKEQDILDRIPPEQKKRLQEILVQSLYESWVARGTLNPVGKTPAALTAEFFRMMINWVDAKGTLKLIVHHRESLLTEARRFERTNRHEMSLLFYATWFEHWINGLIDHQAYKLKLSDRALRLVLRQTGLEAKFVSFPILAQLPPIREQHIKTILNCANLRNSFVHYKFSVHRRNNQTEDDEAMQKATILAAEKAIKYLLRYEQRHIFKGAKHSVRKILFQKSRKTSKRRSRR